MVAVNLKHQTCDVRVDRKTKWGNPFVMKNQSETERQRVIAEHKAWLWSEIKANRVTLDELATLHNKRLGCWCAPKACHADTLTKAAQWAHEKLEKQKG